MALRVFRSLSLGRLIDTGVVDDYDTVGVGMAPKREITC